MMRKVCGVLLILFGSLLALPGVISLLSGFAAIFLSSKKPGLAIRDTLSSAAISLAIGCMLLILGKRLIAPVTAATPPLVRTGSGPIVTLTAAAAEHIRQLLAERGFPPHSALCIAPVVKEGSVQYTLSYDDHPLDDGRNAMVVSEGIQILFDKCQYEYVNGLTVDVAGNDFAFERR
jgi:Fe-S cluster assembly iron-binding protein IscA